MGAFGRPLQQHIASIRLGQEDWDHRVGIPTRSRSGDSPAALIRCAPGIAHLVLKMLCIKYGFALNQAWIGAKRTVDMGTAHYFCSSQVSNEEKSNLVAFLRAL